MFFFFDLLIGIVCLSTMTLEWDTIVFLTLIISLDEMTFACFSIFVLGILSFFIIFTPSIVCRLEAFILNIFDLESLRYWTFWITARYFLPLFEISVNYHGVKKIKGGKIYALTFQALIDVMKRV